VRAAANRRKSAPVSMPFDAVKMSEYARAAALVTINHGSKMVAGAMQEMHGGEWRVSIDHEHLFIVISAKGETIDGPMRQPPRGAVI
jgi:hypothetical protein